MCQVGHKIKMKGGVKFDKNRDKRCTYLNFSIMYNGMYSLMAKSGNITQLKTAWWFGKSGKIVESKDKAYGRNTEYILMHPEKFSFIDKASSNTSQKGDGHCGGGKFLLPNNIQPQIYTACKNSHFAVLWCTIASSETVACAIIFDTKQLDPWWISGEDPFGTLAQDNNMANNTGKGKMFPQCQMHLQWEHHINVLLLFWKWKHHKWADAKNVSAYWQLWSNWQIQWNSPCLLLDGQGSSFWSS